MLGYRSMEHGRRGHSSLNGVAAAISITYDKVLDVEVLSRHCKGCVDHAALKITKPDEYDSWTITHNEICHLNHDGSASSMEKTCCSKYFQSFYEKLRFKIFEILR